MLSLTGLDSPPACYSPEANEIRNIRSRFLAGERVNLDLLRPTIRDSWLRCKDWGVDPVQQRAPLNLHPEEARLLKKNTVLLKAAENAVGMLHDSLDGPYVVTITDQNSQLLEIIGNPDAVKVAEDQNSALGSEWSERQIGTEASSLCSSLGRSVQVSWSEHYWERLSEWVSFAAPISDPLTKDIIGAFGLHWFEDVRNNRSLDLVERCAFSVSRSLGGDRAHRSLALLSKFSVHLARRPNDIVLCLDPRGEIVGTSASAASYLQTDPSELIGRYASNFGRPGNMSGSTTIYVPSGHAHRLESTCLQQVEHEKSVIGYLANLNAASASTTDVDAPETWRAGATFQDVKGNSKKLRACTLDAKRMAKNTLPILICGETGVGKELFAQAIHNFSGRSEAPYLPINCGSLDEKELYVTLFGSEGGAQYGSATGRPGIFELANGGTILLDEIGGMSDRFQAHLLHVLEHGRVVRLGADRPIHVDVRIIATTNKSVGVMLESGHLRSDLYYRIAAQSLDLPPLVERLEDIEPITQIFLKDLKKNVTIEKQALSVLHNHIWPGNVRELRNVICQAVIRQTGDTLTCGDLPVLDVPMHQPRPVVEPSLMRGEQHISKRVQSGRRAKVEETERNIIVQTLRDHRGVVSKAAKDLGMHQTTLYRKIHKYEINVGRVYD